MKLDRNINPDGRGKYALVNLRRLDAYCESRGEVEREAVIDALAELERRQLITYGNESPGDQFFVIKHKDRFAHHALKAYSDAVFEQAKNVFPADEKLHSELFEFGREVLGEAIKAAKSENRIPD